MNTTLIAHTIAARIPEMARDSIENNATVIQKLLEDELFRSRAEKETRDRIDRQNFAHAALEAGHAQAVRS